MSNPNRPILRRSARNDVSFKDRHGWEALGVELEGVVLAVLESEMTSYSRSRPGQRFDYERDIDFHPQVTNYWKGEADDYDY